MIPPNITYKEIDPQNDQKCDCCYKAPETFRRDGPGSPALPTRFFCVTMINGDMNGVYCERCLVLINYLAKKKRKEKKDE